MSTPGGGSVVIGDWQDMLGFIDIGGEKLSYRLTG